MIRTYLRMFVYVAIIVLMWKTYPKERANIRNKGYGYKKSYIRIFLNVILTLFLVYVLINNVIIQK